MAVGAIIFIFGDPVRLRSKGDLHRKAVGGSTPPTAFLVSAMDNNKTY